MASLELSYITWVKNFAQHLMSDIPVWVKLHGLAHFFSFEQFDEAVGKTQEVNAVMGKHQIKLAILSLPCGSAICLDCHSYICEQLQHIDQKDSW
jgi:hypothetical protein